MKIQVEELFHVELSRVPVVQISNYDPGCILGLTEPTSKFAALTMFKLARSKRACERAVLGLEPHQIVIVLFAVKGPR